MKSALTLFDTIRRFQQQQGLKQDATLLPGGETQRTLNRLLEPLIQRAGQKTETAPKPTPEQPEPGRVPSGRA